MLRSHHCDDRAERGTKENDYDDFHHRRTEQHHGFRHPRGSRGHNCHAIRFVCHREGTGRTGKAWPAERLLAVWNSLPGVTPAKRLKDSKTATSRIWERIQDLGEATKPKPAQAGKPKADKKVKGGAQAAKGAPAKAKTSKKATPAKKAPKAKMAAKAKEATGPREGSKTAQVVAMLQRAKGATLTEIMEKMNWQRHTVRGFMAGAMKKAGYTVESFKPEGGERTYRINK